eukprot:TRINITY_DN67_c0_g1_i1.p2 TRINITY_DN67_c0_g1~~TRINITY_DN67_c0_g1_i1.p2  ORF type:complete len:106 (-),score=46.97 TRINITY_DN67_c0_g1_i1:50-367(-)
MVQKIKDGDDLKAALKAAGTKLVVIDFFATWCGPCVFISPHLDEMDKNNENVVFLKVDVDECGEVAEEYGVQAMPTFILMKEGKKVADLTGADKDKLNELVNTHK